MKIEKLMPPVLLTMNAPRSDRNELMKLMIPSLLDVDENWRPMLGALLGKQMLQHCRNQERNSVISVLNELPGLFQAMENNKGRLSDEDLKELPMIQRLEIRRAVEALYSQMSAAATTNAAKAKTGRGAA